VEALIYTYISNSIVTVYFHFFVCADAYLDDETIEEDGSGDNSTAPM